MIEGEVDVTMIECGGKRGPEGYSKLWLGNKLEKTCLMSNVSYFLITKPYVTLYNLTALGFI